MLRVHVEAEGYLIHNPESRDAGGSWAREVKVSPGTRVLGALCRLAQEEPAFSNTIYDGEQLRPGILVTVNGKLQNWVSAQQAELSDGDRIAFYPMAVGG
jgi:molybdopterin converting factor small subunit